MRITAPFVSLLAVLILLSVASADWDPGDPYKWVQLPDLTTLGVDVNATTGQSGNPPYILADDFLCTTTGPLTDIHIWGSWLRDRYPFMEDPSAVSFTLSIHADIPADESPTGYSMPGGLLWMRTFHQGEFIVRPWDLNLEEWWWSPMEQPIFPGDHNCWQYNFFIPRPEAFIQHGTSAEPIVYWLDVQAVPYDPDPTLAFGWKTSRTHWNDAAVWGLGSEPSWQELLYPPPHPLYGQRMDLAFVITGESVPSELDWGDAMDPTYPTLAASNGANHAIVAGVYMGQTIDGEMDGQPQGQALGDDWANLDDEDGVQFLSPLIPGMQALVQVEASVDGFVSAWIDFNGDGDWDTPGDRVLWGAWMPAGSTVFAVDVPLTASAGIGTAARFRFTTVEGGLEYYGPAQDGEVEDHWVYIRHGQDWGDAPDPSYPTLAVSNGATHTIMPWVHLGPTIDAELDGQPEATANGDDWSNLDDEDGVVFLTPLVPGTQAQVQVEASVPGYVSAWIDFNADGNWSAPSDRVLWDAWVPAGFTVFAVDVPVTATPGLQTFTRFRFTTQSAMLEPTGPAEDGEVEDYEVFVEQGPVGYKWIQNPDLRQTGVDVNASRWLVLADDFLCAEPGRLTEFRIWGSWLGDWLPFGGDPGAVQFRLSIHRDIPADESPTGYSMPGELLWARIFEPYQFVAEPWLGGIMEGFYDPTQSYYVFPGDWTCWLYTFRIPPAEAFHQVGMPDEPIVYWLDVKAFPMDADAWFGWKTSVTHWNDDAVWAPEPGPMMWFELRYPDGHPFQGQSIDLAFTVASGYGTGVDEGVLPETFHLRQNLPNPFNPVTTVGYDVPAGGGRVTIEVFDVAGRRVRTLVDGFVSEGRRSVTWDGTDAAGREMGSGVYFCKMKAGEVEETVKMTLLK